MQSDNSSIKTGCIAFSYILSLFSQIRLRSVSPDCDTINFQTTTSSHLADIFQISNVLVTFLAAYTSVF